MEVRQGAEVAEEEVQTPVAQRGLEEMEEEEELASIHGRR